MKATRIKMKPGCANSTKTTEIVQIYIEGLFQSPDTIKRPIYMITLSPIQIAYT